MSADLKDKITNSIKSLLDEKGLFHVETKMSRSKISVYVDSKTGVQLDDCINISRHLQQAFESSGELDAFEIEVSSPGIDQPFRVFQQYEKNIGKDVSVLRSDGIRHDGILQSITPEGIIIGEKIRTRKDGKKNWEQHDVELTFDVIKEAKEKFTFK